MNKLRVRRTSTYPALALKNLEFFLDRPLTPEEKTALHQVTLDAAEHNLTYFQYLQYMTVCRQIISELIWTNEEDSQG